MKISMIEKVLLQIAVGGILIYIAINDSKTQKITNRSLLTLLTVGMGAMGQMPLTVVDRIIGVLLCSVPLLIISMIRPGAFGGGDIKLLAIAGGLLGWRGGLLALCAGVITAGVYSTVMLATGKMKRKDTIALGPFLCFGMVIGYCIIFVNSQATSLTI